MSDWTQTESKDDSYKPTGDWMNERDRLRERLYEWCDEFHLKYPGMWRTVIRTLDDIKSTEVDSLNLIKQLIRLNAADIISKRLWWSDHNNNRRVTEIRDGCKGTAASIHLTEKFKE